MSSTDLKPPNELIHCWKEHITSLHMSIHEKELPLWATGETKPKKRKKARKEMCRKNLPSLN